MKVDRYWEGDWLDYICSYLEIHQHTDHLIMETHEPLSVSKLFGLSVPSALIANTITSFLIALYTNEYFARVSIIPIQ